MAESHLEKVSVEHLIDSIIYDTLQVRTLFDLYDSDADNSLTLNELCKLLEEIGNKITALPAVSLGSLKLFL